MAEDSSHFVVPKYAIGIAILLALVIGNRMPQHRAKSGLLPYCAILLSLFGRESPASALVLGTIWGGWGTALLGSALALSRLSMGKTPVLGGSVKRYSHLGLFDFFRIRSKLQACNASVLQAYTCLF